MVDTAHLAMVSNVTITQSRTSWDLEFGRRSLCVTRIREARTLGPANIAVGRRDAPRLIWPLVIGIVISITAFGLAVVGAVASEPSYLQKATRYSVSVPVPEPETKRPHRLANHQFKRSRPALPPTAFSASSAAILSGDRFDAEDEPYAAKAMEAGEFQEWLGADGQRRFLNAGPVHTKGGKLCRDMALLIRRTDGSSLARSAQRCTTGRTHDVAMEAEAFQDAPTPDEKGAPQIKLRTLPGSAILTYSSSAANN